MGKKKKIAVYTCVSLVAVAIIYFFIPLISEQITLKQAIDNSGFSAAEANLIIMALDSGSFRLPIQSIQKINDNEALIFTGELGHGSRGFISGAYYRAFKKDKAWEIELQGQFMQ